MLFRSRADAKAQDVPQQENGSDCGIFTVRSFRVEEERELMRRVVPVYGVPESDGRGVRFRAGADAVVRSFPSL